MNRSNQLSHIDSNAPAIAFNHQLRNEYRFGSMACQGNALAGRDWINARAMIDGIGYNSNHQGVESGPKSHRNTNNQRRTDGEIGQFQTSRRNIGEGQ